MTSLTVLNIWCAADYSYWQGLHTVPAAYSAAKERVAQQVIAALDRRYPGLAAQVEATDVATPVTYERYTANWRGSIYGWAMAPRKMTLMMGQGMSKTLPGLQNFYMIGQCVEPGGAMCNCQRRRGAMCWRQSVGRRGNPL